jgi:hypothetical protein
MLELNFFCPSHLTEYNTKLKFLEAFWDSEAPRLGEEVLSAPSAGLFFFYLLIFFLAIIIINTIGFRQL